MFVSKANGFHTTTPVLQQAPIKVVLPFQIIVQLVTECMDAAPVCVSVERVSGSV